MSQKWWGEKEVRKVPKCITNSLMAPNKVLLIFGRLLTIRIVFSMYKAKKKKIFKEHIFNAYMPLDIHGSKIYFCRNIVRQNVSCE